MQPLIKVTVLDDIKAEKCEGRCGLDFSSPEALNKVSDSLIKTYGNKVKLEYLDLVNASGNHLYSEILDKVKNHNLSLPILLINDKLRISGYFDIHLLHSTIQIDFDLLNEEI